METRVVEVVLPNGASALVRALDVEGGGATKTVLADNAASGRRQPRALPTRSSHVAQQLSNHLGELGRPEARLSDIEEAVALRRAALRRALATASPERFVPGLAGSLSNHRTTWAIGRPEAALAAIEEAVATTGLRPAPSPT